MEPKELKDLTFPFGLFLLSHLFFRSRLWVLWGNNYSFGREISCPTSQFIINYPYIMNTKELVVGALQLHPNVLFQSISSQIPSLLIEV